MDIKGTCGPMNHFYLMPLKEKERILLKRKAKECLQILKGMVPLCVHCNGFFLSLCGRFCGKYLCIPIARKEPWSCAKRRILCGSFQVRSGHSAFDRDQ